MNESCTILETKQQFKDLETLFKYKTEICKKWSQGFCEYGKNCLFAHGLDEVRPKLVHDNYKTKVCINILRDGFCKYGNRCQFKHPEDYE